MGLPSPAADYVENRLSLDERFIHKPYATYYMKASETIDPTHVIWTQA